MCSSFVPGTVCKWGFRDEETKAQKREGPGNANEEQRGKEGIQVQLATQVSLCSLHPTALRADRACTAQWQGACCLQEASPISSQHSRCALSYQRGFPVASCTDPGADMEGQPGGQLWVHVTAPPGSEGSFRLPHLFFWEDEHFIPLIASLGE